MSVRKLKLNEFGRQLVVGAGIDISGADSYTLRFTKPDGTIVDKTASLGVSETTVEDVNGNSITFSANQYVTYTIESGLLDALGKWDIYLLAPEGGVSVPGDIQSFSVIS